MDDEYPFTAPDGTSYSSYDQYILIGLCDLCGCAGSNLTDDIFAVLDDFAAKTLGEHIWYEDLLPGESRQYVELILHVLTHGGLIEHGGSVRGSWITDLGRDVAKRRPQEVIE